MSQYALISIHDVMPETLNRVQHLIDHLSHLENENISLLVVPGKNWSDTQIETLRNIEKQGFTLSGHGWQHSAKTISGLYHRLHSLFISRNVAEHLALNEIQIQQLLNDCHHWFLEKGFAPPDLYVPPAWAMGKISAQALQDSPFRYFENTAGVYDSANKQQVNLPLIGFEADTAFRASTLKLWNGLNKVASHKKRPARISIHPYDHELRLSKSLFDTLKSVTTAVNYRSIW